MLCYLASVLQSKDFLIKGKLIRFISLGIHRTNSNIFSNSAAFHIAKSGLIVVRDDEVM